MPLKRKLKVKFITLQIKLITENKIEHINLGTKRKMKKTIQRRKQNLRQTILSKNWLKYIKKINKTEGKYLTKNYKKAQSFQLVDIYLILIFEILSCKKSLNV